MARHGQGHDGVAFGVAQLPCDGAASPEIAVPLDEAFIESVRALGVLVSTGR